MGELEQRMQQMRQSAAADAATFAAAKSSEAAQGRQLVDEFVSLMKRNRVPAQPLWRNFTLPPVHGRRFDMAKTVTTTQAWEIVGLGWPLTDPCQTEWGSLIFYVDGKGIADNVATLSVPLPQAKKWTGNYRDSARKRYEGYSQTVVNSDYDPDSQRFIQWLWAHVSKTGTRLALTISTGDVDSSDDAYSSLVWGGKTDAVARMAQRLLDLPSSRR